MIITRHHSSVSFGSAEKVVKEKPVEKTVDDVVKEKITKYTHNSNSTMASDIFKGLNKEEKEELANNFTDGKYKDEEAGGNVLKNALRTLGILSKAEADKAKS